MNAALRPGSNGPWFPAFMMKQIMNTRTAVVALAASAFIAAPALADPIAGKTTLLDARLGANTGLVIQARHGNHSRAHGRYRTNQWGQTQREERQLRRNAVRACRASISRAAWHAGFRDVDFDDDRRVRQIGPNGFRVRFYEVEFENRRRERERDVTCVVRRGHVASLEGIPGARHAPRSRNRGYRYGY